MRELIRHVHLDTTDSTQLHARRELAAGRCGNGPIAFVAITQTAGFGQRGRAWASPPGGLWMTLAWPIGHAGLPTLLSLRVGVAMILAVRRAAGLAERRVRLKWPNDLMVDERKAGGALVEVVGSAAGRVVLVGVGINANLEPHELPESLRASSTTLRAAVGCEVDADALRAEVARALHDQLSMSMPDEEVVGHASAALFGVGRVLAVTLPDGVTSPARIEGIDRDGRLRVEMEGKRVLLTSGMVEH